MDNKEIITNDLFWMGIELDSPPRMEIPSELEKDALELMQEFTGLINLPEKKGTKRKYDEMENSTPARDTARISNTTLHIELPTSIQEVVVKLNGKEIKVNTKDNIEIHVNGIVTISN